MDEPDSSKNESLADLLQRAQRAQEVIGAVNLEKVASHDPDEVAKLGSIANALQQIADGDAPEHVEGVDEVAPEDPSHSRLEALLLHLEEQGFANQLGKVHSHSVIGGGQRDHLLDIIPHREGLPEFEVCLSSCDAPPNNAQGLFIAPDAVFKAVISKPFSRNHWRVVASQPYGQIAELDHVIQGLIDESS